MKKIDTFHISDIDKEMARFNKSHPKSESQQAEIDKYQRIYTLRDNPEQTTEEESIWD